MLVRLEWLYFTYVNQEENCLVFAAVWIVCTKEVVVPLDAQRNPSALN